MMKIYRTQDKQLTRVDDMNEGAWICLTNPTDDEVRRVAATLDIEPADIVAATDPEESARISHSNLDRIGSGQASYQQVVNELRAKYAKKG